MKLSNRGLFAVPIASCLAAGAAQGQRPMKIVDLIGMPQVSNPVLSPDGKLIAYVRSDADWAQNHHVGHVWITGIDGTGAIQLTRGANSESSPRFSPDGKSVAFLASRAAGEVQQLHLIGLSGGESHPLTTHPTSIASFEWAPDGQTIYFLAPDDKNAAAKARDTAKDDAFAFEENGKPRHLWTLAVSTGATKRLTEGEFTIPGFELSRDGRRILYQRAPSILLDGLYESEVWIMDATGGNAVALTHNEIPEQGPTLSPDNGQVLFVASANERFEPYYNNKMFLVPATGSGSPRMLLGDQPWEIMSARWSGDGKAILFIANTGVRSNLYRLDLATGKREQLTSGDHDLEDWAYDPVTGRHAFTIDEPTNPGDVWTLGAGDRTVARVTHVFDYLAKDFKLPRQEAIHWTGKDGTTVEGLLYYPVDYVPGTRYPLVVQTHGGPPASDRFGFGFPGGYFVNDDAVLAGMGYAVLKPNYRGSTGYGDPFLRDMVGHYFQNAHLDVMAGVDQVVSMGVADPDRMVKMGWSAGGHMTNKIITFTNRFKAAAAGAGASNWMSMYAQSDMRRFRTAWFGGTPWQKSAPVEAYWDNSPLKYASNVTTPTLFLVGANDARVPPQQSIEMYRALKTNGVPTHLYMFPREGHVLGELRHQLFKVNAELDWFEKYARGQQYTWEIAPDSSPKPVQP